MTKAKDWTEDAPLAFSKEEAAHKLGLGLRTVERLIANGVLRVLRFPGGGRRAERVLVTLAECERYLSTLADQQEEEANGVEAGASGTPPAAATSRGGGGRGKGAPRAFRRTLGAGGKTVRKEGTNHEALFLSRPEAAKRLNISVHSVDRAIARGELESKRLGGRVLVPVAEIERYAKADNPEESRE